MLCQAPRRHVLRSFHGHPTTFGRTLLVLVCISHVLFIIRLRLINIVKEYSDVDFEGKVLGGQSAEFFHTAGLYILFGMVCEARANSRQSFDLPTDVSTATSWIRNGCYASR